MGFCKKKKRKILLVYVIRLDLWLKAMHKKKVLIAMKFSQPVVGIDYDEIFSPVVKHSSIRILLALVAQFNLELVQLDIKTAFLHGDFEEEIYMTQPVGFRIVGQQHLVCRLKKSLYGLKQSPR